MKQEIKSTILCLYPNSYGVAYALFDSPQDLADYGLGRVRPVDNKRSIAKVKRYLDYFKPDIVFVRSLDNHKGKQHRRNQKLVNLICRLSKEQNLEVHRYTRSQIKEVFNQFEATTKYQISKKLIEWFPQLEAFEFPKRKAWMNESHNVGVFDAASLGVVHYYLRE